MMSSLPSHVPEQVVDHPEISSRQTKRSFFLTYGAILILSLIFLIAGWSVLHLPPFIVLPVEPETAKHLNELSAHLLDEIGIALMIACGLAVTIERFSTREFVHLARKVAQREKKELKKDLFAAIFGVFIPLKIVDEIKMQILGETFVRKNFFMKYIITPVPGQPDYVLVDFKLSYDIENINVGRKDRRFPLKAGISRPPHPSLSDKARFIKVCANGSCCPDPIDHNEGQIPLKSQTGPFLSVDYRQGVTVKAGIENAITIKIHSQTVKHLVGGSSYFSVEYPTLDLDLRVVSPGGKLNVYPGTTPVADGFEWLKEEKDHNEVAGVFHWTLQRPLLAFQCIYLVWEPKDSASEAKPDLALIQPGSKSGINLDSHRPSA